jgi:hypothetical protein
MMAYEIKRTQKAIDRVLNWAAEGEDQGTHCAGMTYENGIRAMFEWLNGDREEAPDEG